MAELVILGSAQDGGLPHAGCLCRNCEAARLDERRWRLPASVGLVSGDNMVLVDATSAFGEQVHMLWSLTTGSATHEAERYDPPGAIILTHGHTGHYVGLWQLDRSVLAAKNVRVLGPPRLMRFLSEQEPWAGMAREGFITLDVIEPEAASEMLPGVRVTAIAVPHRAEWDTDTVALRFDGPDASILYLPDIDSWEAWDTDVNQAVASVDIAILDGCFWIAPPNRNVPHPPIRQSMDRLQPVVAAGASRIVFTHLNHSNPVVDPGSAEAREVHERGFEIAHEGERFDL